MIKTDKKIITLNNNQIESEILKELNNYFLVKNRRAFKYN